MGLDNPTKIEGSVKPSSIEVDGYEPNLSAHRITTLETNQQGMWDYVGGNSVIYAGYAPQGLAVTGDINGQGWILQKYAYDVNGNVISRQIAYGNWNSRAGYTYS